MSAKSSGALTVGRTIRQLAGAGLIAVISLLISLEFFTPSALPAPIRGSKSPRPLATPPPLPLPANLMIPRYPRGAAPFNNGDKLIYEASWEGLPAAEARISMVRDRAHPDLWTGQMWLNSSSLVDRLYRMRDSFCENFAYSTWQPAQVDIFQHENRRRDHWLATFDQPRHLVNAIRTNRVGRTWVRRFSGGAPWGPFSGAMMALSQPLAPNRSYTFDVFSGGNRYVLIFAVRNRERITTALGSFDTLRIEPAVAWLSEGSFRKQARAVTIWVTDDGRHLPIKLEAAVFIGSIVAELTQIRSGPG